MNAIKRKQFRILQKKLNLALKSIRLADLNLSEVFRLLELDYCNKPGDLQNGPQMVDLRAIKQEIMPCYLSKIPCDHTIRIWLNRWGIKQIKSNKTAKRGGGTSFWPRKDVEFRLKRELLAPN